MANLTKTNWVSLLTNSSPYGILYFVDTNRRSFSNRFYRAIVKLIESAGKILTTKSTKNAEIYFDAVVSENSNDLGFMQLHGNSNSVP